MIRRLDVRKTYKLYIGGSFVRSESGRYLEVRSSTGGALDNVCRASRKDLRDAVVAARGAFEGWANRTAYLRSQILYRAAEMLENRAGELTAEITRSTNESRAKARREVTACVDRLVYYAGWSDKFGQVFSSVNPVATPHFNFTLPEATGVVVVLAPEMPSLLPLVTMLAPVILSGNTAIALASERYPIPVATFAEILATSDLPGGVVNLLTGKAADLKAHIASHMDINAIVDASGAEDTGAALRGGTALNLKRYARRALAPADWFSSSAEDPYWILDTVEMKSAWHPIGL